MRKAVIAIVLSILAALLSANLNTVAHAQGDLVAPGNVAAQNTGNPGEVLISWDAVPGAAYYRIGWVAYTDVEPIIAVGGNWLERFAFIDIQNRGQTAHLITRLTPGVQYAFIVASNDGRYGVPQWPPATGWRFLNLTEAPASQAAMGTASVNVAWEAVLGATYYRIGWVVYSDVQPIIAAGGDWLEHFAFIDIANRGQTEHAITRLTPGLQYAFIVAGNDGRYGTPQWPDASGWQFMTPATDTSAAADRTALIALYNATGGPNWTNNTNWLSNETVDEWHGVTIDDDGRVTELNLRENNLSGGIPSGLDQLASLVRLDLQGNDLTGSIPSELGNLANLQRLDLDQNSLTGVLPVQLGALVDLVKLDLNDNLLTGRIPSELGMLTNLENIELSENAFTGCIPAALRTVADNDLVELALPFCGVAPAQAFTTARLGTLFDQIISKTERREAFSPIKESNIGFSAIGDMKALRSEFVASTTETDLYYALSKLSNARRDSHLRIYPVDGGLTAPNRASCVAAPIDVLPDLSDILGPTFFVAEVGEGLASPEVGDVIVGVNGRSMAEYMNEFTPWIRHSSLPGLYWRMAYELPAQVATVPPSLYSGQLDLALENSSGQRYDVTLPYNRACGHFGLTAGYPGFVEVMRRENFNVLIDGNRQMILLQWLDFEYSLIQDIVDLMEYAEREQILNYDMIIDVTFSGGGSRGAYAIQRLVDRPFRVTFGNVRLSDLGKARIERYVNQEPDTDAPDIFGLNLSRSWLIDWARTDATKAIRRGDDYTPAVPFKLAHLPKDSDGILQPAPVRFNGEVAIINARTWGGSHLDQFVAMFVDNDLATLIGVPTGGYSNTWEGEEVLRLADTGRPVVEFQWSIGHTLRPNDEILEGNPAQPDEYIPITRDNFQGYHLILLDRAIVMLDQSSRLGAGQRMYNDNIFVLPISEDLAVNRAASDLEMSDYTRAFYQHFKDEFDFLLVARNLINGVDLDSGIIAAYIPVQNDVKGIGEPRFSEAQSWGSSGRLQGVIFFNYVGDSRVSEWSPIGSGPGLHEFMHRWANFVLPTSNPAHWGFSSANGLLGGFDITSLVDHGSNRYTAGAFNENGNHGRPFSPIELYLAGFVSPEDVPDLLVAEDGAWLVDENGDTVVAENGFPIFTSSQFKTYTIEDIISEHGPRVPDISQSQKEFRAAVILLVNEKHPAIRPVLDRLSEDVTWTSHPAFTTEGDVHVGQSLRRTNFYESTGGRATITMDGLSRFLKSADR